MKMKKALCLLAVILALVIVTACKDDPECEHRGGAIDETINKCGIGNCTCGPTVYGKINGIPVYRVKEVTDAQMSGVFAKLEAAYNEMNPTYKPIINTSKVSAIHFTLNDSDYYSDTKVITFEVGFNISQIKETIELLAEYMIV